MTLNEALAKGLRVCILFKDDVREINRFIVFDKQNELTNFFDGIVPNVELKGNKNYDALAILYVSTIPFNDLVANTYVKGDA